MKSEKQDLARGLRIDRDHWDVPIRVRLRPYLLFSRRLDGELHKLVGQWVHTAAPGALGRRPRRK